MILPLYNVKTYIYFLANRLTKIMYDIYIYKINFGLMFNLKSINGIIINDYNINSNTNFFRQDVKNAISL